jgi:hypothetical protein
MKIARYTLTIFCGLSLLACKQKGKQSLNDAVKKESEAHTDTGNTSHMVISNDQLIVPGKSVGQTGLNEATSVVMTQMGKPDFADAAMGKSVAVWYASHNKKGYATHIYCATNMGNDDTSRVKVIRVSSPSLKTANRVYAGVLISEAKKLYKLDSLGTFKLNGSDRTLFDDIAAGIAVDADRSGNITGIAIHEQGTSIKNAYTAFFGEVK